MALPFQIEIRAGPRRGPDRIADALAQFATALALTETVGLGLHVHGYDESRAQRLVRPRNRQVPGRVGAGDGVARHGASSTR